MLAALRRRLAHAVRPFRQASRTSRALILVGAAVTALIVLTAVVGPALTPYDATQYREVAGDATSEQLPRLAEPSAEHPMGTTRDRFDVLARVVGGARLALVVVLLSTLLATAVGVPLGLLSGYRGGRGDRLLVTAMDAIYVFPPLLLAIVTAFMLQGYVQRGVTAAIAAIGIVYIPQYYRVVRNHTMSVKQEPYVEAARSLGAGPASIVSRYVFSNVVHSVPVIFTLNAADAILTLAALGFLGYGVQPPTPEWGYDISQAQVDITAGVWWTALWPGVAIVVLVTALTLVGEGLNDVMNPLLRARGVAGTKLTGTSTGPAASGPQEPGAAAQTEGAQS